MYFLIFISSIFAATSSILYITSILKGKTKPHRTTRFVVFVMVLLGTIALYFSHNWPTFYLYLIYCLGNFTIFLLSIKNGMGGWTRTDLTCLIISGLGIVFWQLTNNPLLALLASITANIVANVPAVIKTYKYPETETWIYYFLGIFANTIILFAQKTFTFSDYVFPAYFVLLNIVFVVLILRYKIVKILQNKLIPK
jgi:hypothetical protein